MSDEDNLTRRTVLSRGLATTAALGIGTATFAGTAAATECPRTPGYWKNHDWPDTGVVDRINDRIDALELAGVADGQAFLAEPKRGDKGQIMAFHLIATILNYQNLPPIGPETDNPCLETGVRDVDGDDQLEPMSESTRDSITGYALEWLNASAWTPENPIRTWYVPAATVSDGEVLKDTPDDFNNDRLGLEGCGCE